jgi:hypothetical protein
MAQVSDSRRTDYSSTPFKNLISPKVFNPYKNKLNLRNA